MSKWATDPEWGENPDGKNEVVGALKTPAAIYKASEYLAGFTQPLYCW